MSVPAAMSLVAALTFGSVSCRRSDPYMPNDWREPTTMEEPARLQSWLKMNDGKASMQFVKDIRPYVEGGVWRWTGKSPTVVLRAPKANGLKFAADITVPEITLQHTGPVAIRVTINSRELMTQRFEGAGDKRIETPVPDGWVRTSAENIVAMEIDKTWTSPDGTNQYGFVLKGLGFVQ